MKIVAIGGGEIGRPGFPLETEKIDKETIKLSGKKHPKLLFIPTASSDSEGYVEVVKKYFGKRLGCRVNVLYLIKNRILKKDIENRILGTDIIYVGGGNTLKMMKIWRKLGVDKILKEAAERGIVLSGVSAGAICWFRNGNSDSRKFKNPKAPLIKIKCLDLLPALCCPHYNGEKERRSSLRAMTKKIPDVAIALDNCAALEIVDDNFRIIKSKPQVGAYKIYWRKKVFHHEGVGQWNKFEPIAGLFSKS